MKFYAFLALLFSFAAALPAHAQTPCARPAGWEQLAAELDAKAKKGSAQDMALAGYFYREKSLYASYVGETPDADNERAAKWFRKAADDGNALAQYWLGLSYLLGLGVENSYPKARELFLDAAEEGLSAAQNKLGELAGNPFMDKKLFPEKSAESWFAKAAAQGHGEAADMLSLLHAEKQDMAKAAFWNRVAVRAKLPRAADRGYDRKLDEKQRAQLLNRLQKWKPGPTEVTATAMRLMPRLDEIDRRLKPDCVKD